MSQAEIDSLRAVYEAVSRGDWDAALRDAAPGFELRTPDQNPIAGTYRGPEAIRAFFSELWAAFEEVTVQPGPFLELDDRILVSLLMQLRPSDSPAKVEMQITHVWTMRDGTPARCEVFLRREQALEAVGLSEPPMSQENVEVVRAMLRAIGPDTDRDQWLDEFFDPEVEWHDVPGYPSAGVYLGHEALSRHAAEFEDAWADWGVEIEDIRPAGHRVVARIRYHGVGKQSGAPITGGLENPATGAVFELRAGRIHRVLQFVTHAEALEAAGVSE